MPQLVAALTDPVVELFSEEDGFRVTQLPLCRDPVNGPWVKWANHLCLAFAIHVSQSYHGTEDRRSAGEIPFLLMAYSNILVALFGSNRAFDKIIVGQLCVATTTMIWNSWYLYLPIIFMMAMGAYTRLDEGVEMVEEDGGEE